MHFQPTSIDGAFLIVPAPHRDERGTFTRTFCAETLREQGLETCFPQHSIALTEQRGTVRGLHFQRTPYAEAKIVRCVSGAIYNVIADLRPASPTYLRWDAFELSAENGRELYVPKGCAQGCQSLRDDTGVLYMCSEPFVCAAASGVRYDDPALGVTWPIPVTRILPRDRSWPSIEAVRPRALTCA